MIVKHCSSCTSRQQEIHSLKRQVATLQSLLAKLEHPKAIMEPSRLCAACGHEHWSNRISRHHRLPRRLAPYITPAQAAAVLKGQPEIINLCLLCHRFVESISPTAKPKTPPQPCPLPITAEATITWRELMDEILEFERLAEERRLEQEAENEEEGRRVQPPGVETALKVARVAGRNQPVSESWFARKLREATESSTLEQAQLTDKWEKNLLTVLQGRYPSDSPLDSNSS